MNRIKICDTHNDFLTEFEIEQLTTYIKNCQKQEVEIICASYWSTERKRNFIKSELVERAKILRAESNFLLHIEDLWWIKNEDDLNFLIELHPFSCSLTWNFKNNLAGGTKSNGELTDFGKACVERLLKENIIVDVAHLNQKSFEQVTEIVKHNIYCSHTGFDGMKKNRRNLTDEQIEKIIDSGGFMGLFFFDKCVKVKPNSRFDVDDIVANLKYFTECFGFDNIGIGSDFYGIKKPPENLKDYEDFANLHNALKYASFSDTQIEKIFYRNFYDFLKRCEN